MSLLYNEGVRIHPQERINELKALRKTGYSINELVDKFSIPKTTVWHHVHAVRVLPKYLPVLNAKRGGSMKRVQRNWEQAREKARILLAGPHRDLAIAAAMLYWGEGSRKACEFINSNGDMIRTYLTILRGAFNVPEENIKPTMRTFTGMNKRQCLNYWSKVTNIPKRNFFFRYNDGGTRGRTEYGLCRITILKGHKLLKLIRCLISQISEETLLLNKPL